MNVPWLGIGTQTDIATAPLATSFTTVNDVVVAQTASRPDYWFGNYLIVRESVAWRALQYADETRRLLPAATRDIVMWESEDPAPHPNLGGPGVEYQRNSVLMLDGTPAAAVDAETHIVCSDERWDAVRELVASEAEGTPNFWSWYVASMRERCGSGGGTWWAIFEEEIAIATLGLFRAGAFARFAHIQTQTAYRNRGNAIRLMHAAMQRSDAKTSIVVAEADSAAERLYTRIGFGHISTQHTIMRVR